MNTRLIGNGPPNSVPRVGPREFADLLNAARAAGVQWRASGHVYAATIEPEYLSNLIELVYYASLIPEEGSFPRFRLLIPSRAHGSSARLAIRFDPEPALSDPKQLASLAPTLEFAYSALSVEQIGHGLRIKGVVRPGTLASIDQLEPFIELESFSERLTGLEIRVYGPGWLTVRGEGIRMMLKAGEASSLRDIRFNKVVNDWLMAVADAACPPSPPPDTPFQLPTPGRILVELWLSLLSSVLEYRRGGAFVVLDRPAESGLLALEHTVTADSMPSLLKEYLTSRQLAALHGVSTNEKQVAKLRQELVRRRIRSFMQMLGDLSAIDGCVVLDRGMNVLGFGAKIKADGAASCSSLIFQANEDYPDEESLLCRHGTRHRSALQFVKARPNSLAFVVSQDGDLRIFASDDKRYTCEMGFALD